MGLPHLLCFMHFFYIAICFFDTDLSLLIRLSVIEVKRMTSVRYSCKTFKTSKMNDIIILVKGDELKHYDYHRLQRINAS